MTHDHFLNLIKTTPEQIEFEQVITVINENYAYSPARFTNGINGDVLVNEAGSNEGSCKIFAFAQINQLSKEQTLACFGHFYREDVLQNPEGTDHGNIRRFIQYGWDGISFDQQPLSLETSN